ncbi:hypothetical protein L7F22_062197 [Adiantum nelumboides]|nr:hypothetical protein [Adiantum nelumboides]
MYQVKTDLEDKVETFTHALVNEALVSHLEDLENKDDDEDEEEDEDKEDLAGTSGHQGPDDDDDHQDLSGTCPSSGGASNEPPPSPPANKPKPPVSKDTEHEQTHTTGTIGGNQSHTIAALLTDKKHSTAMVSFLTKARRWPLALLMVPLVMLIHGFIKSSGGGEEMSHCGQWSASTLLFSSCQGRLVAPELATHSRLPSFSTLQVVCCSQHNSDRGHGVFKGEVEPLSIGRREVLSAVVVTASIWTPLWSDLQSAQAADLTQRIQRSKLLGRIQERLRVFVMENQNLIPSLLQLALNDAATYDKASKSGGPNGSIYLSAELNRAENKGLAGTVQLLELLKKEIDSSSQGGPITWADLIQIAGQSAVKRTFLNAAIKKCGGNVEKGQSLYLAYGSTGQWGQFDKQLGRSQATEPDPEGRVLFWDQAPVPDMKAKFFQLGFKPRQGNVKASAFPEAFFSSSAVMAIFFPFSASSSANLHYD